MKQHFLYRQLHEFLPLLSEGTATVLLLAARKLDEALQARMAERLGRLTRVVHELYEAEPPDTVIAEVEALARSVRDDIECADALLDHRAIPHQTIVAPGLAGLARGPYEIPADLERWLSETLPLLRTAMELVALIKSHRRGELALVPIYDRLFTLCNLTRIVAQGRPLTKEGQMQLNVTAAQLRDIIGKVEAHLQSGGDLA